MGFLLVHYLTLAPFLAFSPTHIVFFFSFRGEEISDFSWVLDAELCITLL